MYNFTASTVTAESTSKYDSSQFSASAVCEDFPCFEEETAPVAAPAAPVCEGLHIQHEALAIKTGEAKIALMFGATVLMTERSWEYSGFHPARPFAVKMKDLVATFGDLPVFEVAATAPKRFTYLTEKVQKGKAVTMCPAMQLHHYGNCAIASITKALKRRDNQNAPADAINAMIQAVRSK